MLSDTDNSATYEVFDSGLRRTRAVVKFQELGRLESAEAAERDFESYCNKVVSVAHPGVGAPYTYGTFTSEDGYAYGYTTRAFVDGVPLSAFQAPLDDEAVLLVAVQLCHALDALAAHGLRHHDLKCDNVIVRRAASKSIDHVSQCVLIDLTYRAQHESQKLNEVTLQYLAPELLESATGDQRADLYSLGVLLYRLASGRLPFEGAQLGAILRQQRARDYPPLSATAHDAQIRTIVHALIEPNPDNRPQSAQAVLASLGTSSALISSSLSHNSLNPVGFVGRQAELRHCVDRLAIAGAPGATEVVGPRGAGVTTFLRELQDQLETQSIAVLSAHPQMVEGEDIREQLSRPVGLLARERRGDPDGSDTRVRTTTELLDDLLVAAESHRVVLFIDEWRRCSVAETLFLARIVRQFGDGGLFGRVHLVLGWSGAESPEAARALDSLIEERVTLGGLEREELSTLVRYSCGCDWPRADIGLLHAETGGLPGATLQLVRDACGLMSEGRPLGEAIAGAVTAQRARPVGGTLVVHVLDHPSAHAIVALCAWNEWLSDRRWRAVCEALGCGEGPLNAFVERDTNNNVRSLHRESWAALWASVDEQTQSRITDTVLDVCHTDWRSDLSSRLVAMLRFVGRTKAPRRYRWHVRRALMMLLRIGQMADVEWCAQAMRASAAKQEQEWLALFTLAAQTESGRRADTELQRPDAVPPPDTGLSFYQAWVEARAWRRAGYTEHSYKILRRIQASPLAVARMCRSSLLEDFGLVAAAAGDREAASRARKTILGLALAWVARTRNIAGPAAIRLRRNRAALRGCRKAANYYRVQYRAYMNRNRFKSAVQCARRERMLNRIGSDRVREAQCLNNEGIALYKAGAGSAAAGVFERCAKLREALDDERGLTGALNNLATTLNAGGRFGRVASVLNRSLIVATRNGLTRLRSVAMLGLGVAYARRGLFRDAHSAFRRALRSVVFEDDAPMWFKAAYNCAAVALDRWRVRSLVAYLDAIEMRASRRPSPPDAHALLLRAEWACRASDIEELRRAYHALVEEGVPTAQGPYYRYLISGSYLRQQSRQAPNGVRLRTITARWCRRMSFESFKRLVACSRRYGVIRERIELVNAYYRSRQAAGAEELSFGASVLSWLEFREGHDDLQVELRAHLSRLLAAAGRTREAWSLLEAALLRFQRLERKLSDGEAGQSVLERLGQALKETMAGHESMSWERSGRLSESLCAAAFRTFLKFRGAHGGTTDDLQSTVESIATVLESEAEHESIEPLLDIAIEATGAERAIVVLDHGERRIHASRARTQRGGDGEISWATVARALALRRPQCFSDALSAEELASHRSIAVLRLRSLACVPIRITSNLAAVLYVDHQGLAGLFDESDVALLRVIAAAMGGVLRSDALAARAENGRRELQEAHAHMVRTERNRVFGEVAGGISHDLRNILTAIIARSQMLRRVEGAEARDASVRAIESAATAGADLLERLQQCSRDHTSQKPEALDVAQVVREAIELLGHRFVGTGDERIQHEIESDDAPIVFAVPGELREVFLNLIANACDAMVDGGRISISIRKAARQVVIEVRDTGPGMPADTVSRAFEPFFTTKGSAGTGLGLVVVQNTLARCGGTVDIESEVGKGTCFRIHLPAYHAAAAQERAT